MIFIPPLGMSLSYFCLGAGVGAWFLDDRVHREQEHRAFDLVGRVLVPVGETRESADPHDDDRVTGIEHHARRGHGDLDVDAEPLLHGVNGRGVRRVAAGLHALLDEALHLVYGQRATVDRAVTGEH